MTQRAEDSMNGAAHDHDDAPVGRRPFRAVDVLSGGIDRLRGPAPRQNTRTRKQISAQLEPAQVRLLGELHARLNATTTRRIEKSDLVGLGIELLAAALAEIEDAVGGFDPAPDEESGTGPQEAHGATGVARAATATAPRDVDDVRAYLRTYVRGYGRTEPGGKR